MDNKLRGHVEDLKKQGNDLFINRKYEEAIRVYSKVLNHPSFRGVTNDGMEPKEILLKQSFYLMRGRAYENVGKSERAKKDFDMCIEILDNTKYAFKARLVRAQLDIQTVEHLKLAKLDCEAVMKVKILFSFLFFIFSVYFFYFYFLFLFLFFRLQERQLKNRLVHVPKGNFK